MPQNSNFWLLRGHRFWQKIEFTVKAPNHGGHTLGSILGPMESHWGHKMGQIVKNYHAPKFEFLTTPRSSIGKKNRIYCCGAKSRWGPPRVHLGIDGIPLGKKNGSKPKKITMPEESNFWLLRSHRFGQNIEFTVMAPYHGVDPLGSILGPMGYHWGQKMGQNCTKLPCPKIWIFDYSVVIDLGKKSNLRLWREITVGTA